VVQDVWNELDSGGTTVTAVAVFKRSTWRTADIDVPSRSGWDIATSLELPLEEEDVEPPEDNDG
jgi:hypothetical protein